MSQARIIGRRVLTAADTSSYVTPALAASIRRYHPRTEEFVIRMNPDESEIRALLQELSGFPLVIAGTINARSHAGQAALVNGLLGQGTPTIAVALRLPYDVLAYKTAPTYLCTYSILAPSMEAIADALWGHIPFRGQLPVELPKFGE